MERTSVARPTRAAYLASAYDVSPKALDLRSGVSGAFDCPKNCEIDLRVARSLLWVAADVSPVTRVPESRVTRS